MCSSFVASAVRTENGADREKRSVFAPFGVRGRCDVFPCTPLAEEKEGGEGQGKHMISLAHGAEEGMLWRRRRALPRLQVMALRYCERLVSKRSANTTSPSTLAACRPASAKFSAAKMTSVPIQLERRTARSPDQKIRMRTEGAHAYLLVAVWGTAALGRNRYRG